MLWTKYHSLQMSPFLLPKNEKSRFCLILQKTDSLKLEEFFIFCQQDGLLSGSSHIFFFWFLVDSYQKTKVSAVIFLCLLFAENINFLLVNQHKFSQLKLVLRSKKISGDPRN